MSGAVAFAWPVATVRIITYEWHGSKLGSAALCRLWEMKAPDETGLECTGRRISTLPVEEPRTRRLTAELLCARPGLGENCG